MNVLVWGLLLFGITVAVHALALRLVPTWSRGGAFYLVFLLVLVCGGLASSMLSPYLDAVGIPTPRQAWEHAHIIVFLISLGAAYRAVVLALETPSPTLEMVLAVARAGPAGLERTALDELITNERCVTPRITYLLKTGLVRNDGGRLMPTKSAGLFLGVANIYRGLAGISGRPSG